ncbi:MAG: hypothetical protein IIU30_03955 [Treponema sp.]|nr:hypothetical protein [Treponema sp.]
MVAKRQVSFPLENSWSKIAWMQFLTQALPIGARLYFLPYLPPMTAKDKCIYSIIVVQKNVKKALDGNGNHGKALHKKARQGLEYL